MKGVLKDFESSNRVISFSSQSDEKHLDMRCFDCFYYRNKLHFIIGSSKVYLIEVDESQGNFCIKNTHEITFPGLFHDFFSLLYLDHGIENSFYVFGTWTKLISFNLYDYLVDNKKITLKYTQDFDDYAYNLVLLKGSDNIFSSVSRGFAYIWKLEDDGSFIEKRHFDVTFSGKKYFLNSYQMKSHPEKLLLLGDTSFICDWGSDPQPDQRSAIPVKSDKEMNYICFTSFIRDDIEYFVTKGGQTERNEFSISIFFLDLKKVEFNHIRSIGIGKDSISNVVFYRLDILCLFNRYIVLSQEEEVSTFETETSTETRERGTYFRFIDLERFSFDGKKEEGEELTNVRLKSKQLFHIIRFSSGHNDNESSSPSHNKKKVHLYCCSRPLFFASGREGVYISRYEFDTSDGLEEKDLLERFEFLKETLFFKDLDDSDVDQIMGNVRCIDCKFQENTIRIPTSFLFT